MATFAEVTSPYDELTGPEFLPGGRAMFLNLQRSGFGGVTVAILGPFPRRRKHRSTVAARPDLARPDEESFLRDHGTAVAGIPLAAAAALINLRRRGLVDEVPQDIDDVAKELGAPTPIESPKKRLPKTF